MATSGIGAQPTSGGRFDTPGLSAGLGARISSLARALPRQAALLPGRDTQHHRGPGSRMTSWDCNCMGAEKELGILRVALATRTTGSFMEAESIESLAPCCNMRTTVETNVLLAAALWVRP